MPRRLIMSDLVLRCQRRCDREGDGHISAGEWTALLSEQYGELYSIVAEAGLRHFETTTTITSTGVASYTEPTDHMGTVIVRYVSDSSGGRRDLREIMSQEQSRWSGMTGEARRYALIDDLIYLFPTPPAGQQYEVAYIPQPPDLTAYALTATVDVVNPAGEAFLVWGVAVKALAKSEADTQLAERERDAARVRLAEWAVLRAFTESPHREVVDNDDYYGNYLDPGDWSNR